MEDDFFYEDLDPDFDGSLGAFQTGNPIDNRFQRQFIRISPERSKFKKKVESVLCVHGWKNEDRREPMTLVVFSVSLYCTKPDYRYESVEIWLTFDEIKLPLPIKSLNTYLKTKGF
ncbi:hypothetical protein F4810DRAFT_693230 [Camillea tinctor]|nr:hypothetical protein F4810DRAFT_693230 [Camillea tinctor]